MTKQNSGIKNGFKQSANTCRLHQASSLDVLNTPFKVFENPFCEYSYHQKCAGSGWQTDLHGSENNSAIVFLLQLRLSGLYYT